MFVVGLAKVFEADAKRVLIRHSRWQLRAYSDEAFSLLLEQLAPRCPVCIRHQDMGKVVESEI